MLHIHRSLFTGTGATLSPTFSASGGRPCELLPPAITVASSTGGPSEAEGENHVEKQFRYAEHLRRQLEPTAFDFFVGHGSGGGGSLRYRSRPAGQRDSVRCGNFGEGKESFHFLVPILAEYEGKCCFLRRSPRPSAHFRPFHRVAENI